MPQLRKVKWANGIEQAAIIAKPGKRHYNPEHGHKPNYIVLPVGKRDQHPTEKPVALFEPVIASWTFPGDTVIDPFLGSGTTLVAAYHLGRSAIGVEINESFCELAAKRLDEEIAQGRLFTPTETAGKNVQLTMDVVE
ncbi:site-specific DNA-methyltransferase [Patescibacteria group bacterium]|nr:site-specific DNA-methyltransferase [Patescibacteria group bacterium]